MASLMLSCHSATDAANTQKVTCHASSADRLCMDRTTYCHHRCLGTALLMPVHFSTQIKLFNLTLKEPQNIPGLACNLEERHFTIKFRSERLGRFVLLVVAGGRNVCALHRQTDAPCTDRQMCSAVLTYDSYSALCFWRSTTLSSRSNIYLCDVYRKLSHKGEGQLGPLGTNFLSHHSASFVSYSCHSGRQKKMVFE